MSRILGLDAVVLIAENLDEQRKFYRDILGLEVLADHTRIAVPPLIDLNGGIKSLRENSSADEVRR